MVEEDKTHGENDGSEKASSALCANARVSKLAINLQSRSIFQCNVENPVGNLSLAL